MSAQILKSIFSKYLSMCEEDEEAYSNYQSALKQLNELKRTPPPPKYKKKFRYRDSNAYTYLWATPVLGLIVGIVLWMYVPEVTHPFYTSIVGYVGLTIIYWLFERRRKNKEIYDYNGRLKNGYDNYVSWWTENQAQIPALEQEVNKLNNRYRQTQNRLNKYAVSIGLHEKYQDRSTVEAFLSYVEEGRCDTLKECINLKEQEWQEFLRYQEEYRHRRTVEKAAAQQQEQLEQIREETSRAADESKRAADLAAAEAIFEAVKYYESRKK